MKIKTYSDFIAFEKPEDLCNAYYFHQGLTDSQVEKITDYATVHQRQQALVDGELKPEVCRGHVTSLPLNDETGWLYQRVGSMASKVNEVLWNFSLAGMSEPAEVVEYTGDEQGHYNWHMDLGQDKAVHRKICVVIQLSDPSSYEGGDLQLYLGSESVSIQKEKGYVCVFPAYVLQQITPVTKGHAQFLVLRLSGEAFR